MWSQKMLLYTIDKHDPFKREGRKHDGRTDKQIDQDKKSAQDALVLLLLNKKVGVVLA